MNTENDSDSDNETTVDSDDVKLLNDYYFLINLNL